MCQQQRIVVAITLVSALFLAVPARAARPGEDLPSTGIWERAWSWLVELIPGGVPHQQAARWEKEGSAINPDGRTTPSTAVPPGASLDEGGAINPDGHK